MWVISVCNTAKFGFPTFHTFRDKRLWQTVRQTLLLFKYGTVKINKYVTKKRYTIDCIVTLEIFVDCIPENRNYNVTNIFWLYYRDSWSINIKWLDWFQFPALNQKIIIKIFIWIFFSFTQNKCFCYIGILNHQKIKCCTGRKEILNKIIENFQ